tara:strand:- start:653 stop:823 length:171 start_codon:yes stop_codon:yes gene_type:complete
MKYKDERKGEFRIKYCEDCRRPWEKNWLESRKKTAIKYHPGFPTFGLERTTCVNCK